MADIVDVQIKMIAPEKWRQNERLARAENVARRGLTLALGYDPMLHPNAPSTRIRPARNVPGGKHPWHAGLQVFIDYDAVVSGNPRFFGERGVRPHTDSDHDEIAL